MSAKGQDPESSKTLPKLPKSVKFSDKEVSSGVAFSNPKAAVSSGDPTVVKEPKVTPAGQDTYTVDKTKVEKGLSSDVKKSINDDNKLPEDRKDDSRAMFDGDITDIEKAPEKEPCVPDLDEDKLQSTEAFMHTVQYGTEYINPDGFYKGPGMCGTTMDDYFKKRVKTKEFERVRINIAAQNKLKGSFRYGDHSEAPNEGQRLGVKSYLLYKGDDTRGFIRNPPFGGDLRNNLGGTNRYHDGDIFNPKKFLEEYK
jgi:hypothetical protein